VINDGVPICIQPIGPFTLEPKYSLMIGFHKKKIYNVIYLKWTLTPDKVAIRVWCTIQGFICYVLYV